MATQRGLLGDEYVVADKAISIPIERYNNLIRKEFAYDEFTRNKQIIVRLSSKTEEGEHK